MSELSGRREVRAEAERACHLLEEGSRAGFFKRVERLLLSNLPFGAIRPLGEVIGARGLERPKLYFAVLDEFFRKDLDYGYRVGLIDARRMRMSEEEVQRSRVYGWRAGIVGLAFDRMGERHPDEVVRRLREYIILSSHWAASDTFADKAFNGFFRDRFDWVLALLRRWALDGNPWIRNAAGFAVHAPVQRRLLDRGRFLELLSVLDPLMEDPDINVRRKVGWSLRVVSRHYPDETLGFMMGWASADDTNVHWVLRNGMRHLDEGARAALMRAMQGSRPSRRGSHGARLDAQIQHENFTVDN